MSQHRQSGSKREGAPKGVQAVLYARVSSREQEEEGWSLDSQTRLLRDYAAELGLAVVAEFVETQTAKVAGRRAFGEMVEFLKGSPGTAVLVEKTDRLYRNIRDWVTIEDLGTTLHFVREGQIIGPESRSSDKLIHGFKVLMARNYVENLSEEIRKGLTEKALQGIYPSHAPLGYLNVQAESRRKKAVALDPERGPLVRQLFDRYEAGTTSLKDLAKFAFNIGLRSKKGRRVGKSSLFDMLSHPIYCGLIRWNGEVFPGSHEPLISRQQWERCQEILHGRKSSKFGYGQMPFAYRGLIRCSCGQVMSGEVKKGRYVYYHCQGPKGLCSRPYVREELLTEAFRTLLAELTPPPMMADWLRKAVVLGHQAQMEFQKAKEERIEAEIATARSRLEQLYLDKIEGEVPVTMYRMLRDKFEVELREHESLLGSYRSAGTRTDDEALETLELSLGVLRRFEQGNADERNQTLRLLLSNCVWQDGNLEFELRSPFDLMLKAKQNVPEAEPSLTAVGAKDEDWWR